MVTFLLYLAISVVPYTIFAQSLDGSKELTWTFPAYITDVPEKTIVECSRNGQVYSAEVQYPQTSVRLDQVLGYHSAGIYECRVFVMSQSRISQPSSSFLFHSAGSDKIGRSSLSPPQSISVR